MKHDVFLSYSRQDKLIMHRVRDMLRGASLSVWTDETLTPGTESWKNAIEDAIHDTSYLVVLLSPTAKRSDWIEKEMDYARACGVPIIPVLALGDDERSAIPFELINVQRIDIRHNFEEGMDLLIATLKGQQVVHPDSHKEAIPAVLPPLTTHMNPHNAYNQLMVAWWLAWHPERLREHGLTKENITFKKIASWIGSYFLWWGFIIPPLGYALGTIDPDNATVTKSTYMLIVAMIYIGLWLITALFGWQEGIKVPAILYLTSAIGVAFSQILLDTEANVVFNDPSTTPGLWYVILLGIIVAFGYGIGFQLANGLIAAALGQASGTLLFIVYSGLRLDIVGGAAVILTVFIAFLTATMIAYELNSHRRSWLNYVVITVFVVSITAMLYLFFLGGWRQLA